MIEQLTLEGIEHLQYTGINNPGLTRRHTDQSYGNQSCQDIPAPGRFSTQAFHDTPLVSVFTLGRFSL